MGVSPFAIGQFIRPRLFHKPQDAILTCQEFRRRLLKMLARRLLILAGIVSLAGCGGGGTDLEAPLQPVRPRVRIHWPALGRATEATPYTYSVAVYFKSAINETPWGLDALIMANRAGVNEATTEYVGNQEIRPGFVEVTMQFYSGPNGTGRELKRKTVLIQPSADGSIPDIILPETSTDQTVKKVVLECPSSVSVGEKAQFGFDLFRRVNPDVRLNQVYGTFLFEMNVSNEPNDPENGPVVSIEPVGVNPDASYYSFPSYMYNVRGLRPGKATIWGRIDGVDSNPVTITVTAP